MGFFDGMKSNKLGRQAYNAHVQANELQKRGKMAEAKEKYAEAMALYKQAYDAGCRKNGILMSYSVLMMRNGLFAQARELMKEIAQDTAMSEETHFDLRINYSICLWRLGLLDKAIETIRYAGKYAKNSAYYGSLGTFLVEQAGQSGEFAEAKALLDEAMDYDDEDASTLDNLGEYYRLRALSAEGEERLALRSKSIECFEKARKIKPAQITTLYALAKFALEDGDSAKAKEYLDRAIIHYSSRVCPVSIEELRSLRAQAQ